MLLPSIMKEESTKELMIKLSGSMIMPTFKNNKTFNSSISKKEDFKKHSMTLKLKPKLRKKDLYNKLKPDTNSKLRTSPAIMKREFIYKIWRNKLRINTQLKESECKKEFVKR